MEMIPFAKPLLGDNEIEAVRRVILSGWVTQGPKVEEFENAFASYSGARFACAVSSCTTALHVALATVGVRPGDVVITVSHSFIATANAVRYCGAEPVFVDIAPDTYCISVDSLKQCLHNDCERKSGRLFYKNLFNLALAYSPLRYIASGKPKKAGRVIGRVSAILVVHQMGMPCNLKEILALAKKFNIPVVEDAACAAGSEIKIANRWDKIGKPHGDIACFSFHPRKIITTGDGGMLTTENPEYDRHFRLLRQHGMSISDSLRHSLRKITFEKYLITGYNYRMTDLQAAIGIEQLKRLPEMVKKRRELAKVYKIYLPKIDWLEALNEPDYCRTNWQSYPVKIKPHAPISRNRLMQYLLDRGIPTRRGIMNAHQERPYKSCKLALPVSERMRDMVILLPFFDSLKKSQIDFIIKMLMQTGKLHGK